MPDMAAAIVVQLALDIRLALDLVDQRLVAVDVGVDGKGRGFDSVGCDGLEDGD
jgi:hypothetical protein